MLYFTGLESVPNIEKNTYLPGAIADHLSSVVGVLTGSTQMNIHDLIKAGVTGQAMALSSSPVINLPSFPILAY